VELAWIILTKYGWGFLGPRDRSKVLTIWRSFGDRFEDVADHHFPDWERAVENVGSLNDLDPVKQAKLDFKADIKAQAQKYLDDNHNYLTTQHASVVWETANVDPVSKQIKQDEDQRLLAMAATARKLAKIRADQNRMLATNVGFKYVHSFGSNVEQVSFNPYVRPPYVNQGSPTWDEVSVTWQLASAEMASKGSKYAWLLGLLKAEGGDDSMEMLGKVNTAKSAGALIGYQLNQQIKRMEAIQARVGGGDIE
jgi:hypothetical protein